MMAPITQWLLSACLATAMQSADADQRQTAYLDASLARLDGSHFSLSDYVGKKPVYLKIWASWCIPCVQQMPSFQQSYQRHGDQIEMIGVNFDFNDDPEAVREVIEEYQLTLPIASDHRGELAAAFDTLETPDHILLDRQGRILHRGHDFSPALARKLARLATAASTPSLLPSLDAARPQALLFGTAWCESYLQKSRPDRAERCALARQTVNRLQKRHPEFDWTGILSPLWTGPTEVAEYRQHYPVEYPLAIDYDQRAFRAFNIRDEPTLVIVRDNRELLRIHAPSEVEKISQQLRELVP